MKLVKAIIISSIFLFACKKGGDVVQIPENIMSQTEMIELLADIHTADAYAETQRIEEQDKLLQLKKTYFENILEEHQLSQEEFDVSLAFYQENISLLHETYELVLEEMSMREAELNNNENQ